MIILLVSLIVLSIFTSSAAVDPVYPTVVNTGVISTVVINENQTILTTNKTNEVLLMPFNFTSLSESFDRVSTSNISQTGIYSLNSLDGEGLFLIVIDVDDKIQNLPIPTLGPCAGNALTYEHQPVWSVMDFQSSALTGIQLTFTISRIYQDAALTLEVPQWILFGPGKSSYYAVSIPNSDNMALQIDIRRHNSSVPSPSKSFSYLYLATEQKCLNPTSPILDPGIIERISIENSDPDLVSCVFSALIPFNSIVYVKLLPNLLASQIGLDFTYSISARMVTRSSPSPPNSSYITGVVLGVFFGILVGGVLGLAYYKFTKKEVSYDPL